LFYLRMQSIKSLIQNIYFKALEMYNVVSLYKHAEPMTKNELGQFQWEMSSHSY
jgi:hypothetical protein